MTRVNVLMLDRYRVDREAGMTANGPEQLVILVLKADGIETAYAISKVDAMIISTQLSAAAHDAQAH